MRIHERFTYAPVGTRVALVAAAVLVAACDDPQGSDGRWDDPGPGITSVGGDSSDGNDSDSGSDSDSGGDSDSDSGDDGVLWCGETDLAVAPTSPQIVLVLDKSNSMVSNTWDHDGVAATAEITRWHSLYDVVGDLVTDFDDSPMEIGALMFPSVTLTSNDAATACLVPSEPDVAVAGGNADDILAAMPAADSTQIWGGTPTAAAIQVAADELRMLDPSMPRAIVLITDGAANCMQGVPDAQIFTRYDETLAPLVRSIYETDGIPTYVVGIDIVNQTVDVPVANPWQRLGEVALAGGVPAAGDEPFYNTRDELELYDALRSIADGLQCSVALDDLPSDPDRVHLALGDAALAYSASCEGGTGWRYGEAGSVELCGSTCDSFLAGGEMHAAFDCVPEK
ncbi:MAG: VWA domain-containing protein [Nannocystaceae bacterium]|nr:VWA domain-containing protein [Nannocystaceae bacterium]